MPEAYKQAAQKMLQAYGLNAQERARKRAEKLLADGDQQGYSMWMQIHQAIDQLRFCGRLPGIT